MKINSAQRKALVAIVGEKYFLTDPQSLADASVDETPGLAPMQPQAVIKPADSQQCSAILAYCHAEGLPVTPRGAGTGHSGGCVPAQGGLVIDMMRLNKIIEISPQDFVARVQPGVILQDLHHAVEARGLFYPPDPNSLESCSLGGNIAENAGGPRALRYGTTRDYILGLEILRMDGQALRLGKRSIKGVSGYDLTALLVGSEGTLGLITAATLRLIPNPRELATALVTFADAERAARAIESLMLSGILPRTLEYMDGRSIDALRPLASFKFPEGIDAALLVETDGDDEDAVFAQLLRAVEILDQAGASSTLVAQNPRQRSDLWAARRRLTEATRMIKKHKIAEDIAVPRGRIPEALARVAAIGEANGLWTAAYGHAGDGNLHVQVLFDDAERDAAAVEKTLDAVMHMTIELGGTLSGEHGIGLAKKRFMPLEHSAQSLAMMRAIKAVFDPKDLLNPGKIFA